MKAATRGAAGVAARVAENYITARGDVLIAGSTLYGRVDISKPMVITAPNGSDASVLTIEGGQSSQRGLVVVSDPTSPVASAARLAPQNADPTSKLNGDIYVNSVSDQIAHYSAALGRFQNLDPVVLATIADSSTIVEPDVLTPFDQKYNVPANMLRIGSILRIKAWGTATRGTASRLSIRARYGTFDIGVIAIGTNIGANCSWQLEAYVIFRLIGAAGSFHGWQRMEMTEGSSPPSAERMDQVNGLSSSVPTDAGQDVEVRVQLLAGNASSTATMKGFIVEVI